MRWMWFSLFGLVFLKRKTSKCLKEEHKHFPFTSPKSLLARNLLILALSSPDFDGHIFISQASEYTKLHFCCLTLQIVMRVSKSLFIRDPFGSGFIRVAYLLYYRWAPWSNMGSNVVLTKVSRQTLKYDINGRWLYWNPQTGNRVRPRTG